jgi:hypothetical protein
MTLSGRLWALLATAARIDMAAGIAITVALLVWLAWH